MIQKEFQSVIKHALEICINHFASRLDAIYIGGSVATGEAWPGESDADWFMFLQQEPTDGDKSWCKENETDLVSQYPVVKEFHLNVYSTEYLKTEHHLMKFIFRYNSLCLFGENHLKEIETAGITIPKPSRELAKGRVGWVKNCVAGLAKNNLPEELFQGGIPAKLSKLSSTDYLASRKLVRNFVLLEGAHVLMLTNDFQSFQQNDVLRKIAMIYPQWKELISTASDILKDPFAAKVAPDKVRERTLPFAKWAIGKIENE